jgi:hypothetical protein
MGKINMALNTYAVTLPYFSLKPRDHKADVGHLAITFNHPVTILSAYIWTGYDQGSQFEAGCRVWLNPMSSSGFTGSIMLGGVYLHKHNIGTPYGTAYQNDFYQLQQLRDIVYVMKGVLVQAGTTLVIDRDIFNIDYSKNFNAWDVELIIVVNEGSLLSRALWRLKSFARRMFDRGQSDDMFSCLSYNLPEMERWMAQKRADEQENIEKKESG